MDTSKLRKFAQFARRSLIGQVSSKLKLVLAENSAARRESLEAVEKLEAAIKEFGTDQVIERVAYIWFNRFCALRFMDVNRYNRIGVVSPAEGQFQPEILAEAKMGHLDEEMVPQPIRQKFFALLDGKSPSNDPQGEAYRLLVVAACNFWNKAMPFLFQRIDDYTELLMPDDLLSGNSILAYTREAMTPVACEDVEVIGWLYQFYISEKKDEVFADLKNNKKITPENIPAATQLFTPHWIVRYLVENSLGRLWLLNHPNSKLAEQMNYYIKPEQPETDFLRITKPEDIKICDPACGSGHMLTYAFDLLYAIYEEEGYEPAAIPEKILTQNLYGIEIDERAGELAAFALTMKARAKQRRFFNKGIKPNICVLEPIQFEDGELTDYLDFVGRDLFTASLRETLHQFKEADNFGSLIRPAVTDVGNMLALLESKDVGGQIFLYQTHQKVLQVLRQTDYLSPKYHVVIANPPYMGGKGMNGRLGAWVKDHYPDSKSDLFAIFIERNLELTQRRGMVGMITMQSWMFLSSFEKLRSQLLAETTILSMAHLGARAFDSIGGEVVSTTAFVLENNHQEDYKGSYLRLVDGNSEAEKSQATKEAIANPQCGWFYRACAADFKKIPGSPIAYAASNPIRDLFNHDSFAEFADTRLGMATADNNLFIRLWYEVSIINSYCDANSRQKARDSKKKWFPYQKGGDYRKWYGNLEYYVNWENDGYAICNFKDEETGKIRSHNYNFDFIFRKGVTWNALTSSKTSARISENSLFDNAGSSLFLKENSWLTEGVLMGLLNSNLMQLVFPLISPTLNYQPGDIAKLPAFFPDTLISKLNPVVDMLVDLAKKDWNSYETAWDFTSLPLISVARGQWPVVSQENIGEANLTTKLSETYTQLRTHWQNMTLEMQQLEEENNRIFIEAYGLQDELTPEVPLKEITLTCNPYYRYGVEACEVGSEQWSDMEARLLQDTMKELISYAVGCMFGRYSLDQAGLILANQGETLDDYLQQIPNPTFAPDKDNVIPILEGEWFSDDITERFRKFLRVTFGEDNYQPNIQFIENALGKTIEKYFLKDFYADHLKRYKKRPIYWLFSSPKGTFNALIYMHRYRPDTLSIVLNDYLREFRTKLAAQKQHLEAVSISESVTAAIKTKALKDIEVLQKMLQELDDYERNVLYPLATAQIEIDLDDGVKVNYPKFGKALKPIPGLN